VKAAKVSLSRDAEAAAETLWKQLGIVITRNRIVAIE